MGFEKKEIQVKDATLSSKKGNTSAGKVFEQQGRQKINTMSDEEREVVGALSHTLHFCHLYGLQSKPSDRRTAGNTSVGSFKPVGIKLKTDIAIKVPQIDPRLNADTGIDPATQIKYIDVAAGEEFIVSYYEFMFLILRKEYAGRFEAKGSPKGAYFSVKGKTYMAQKAKLPTPTVCFTSGSPKENMVAIDYALPDGEWEIKAEFREKFGSMLEKEKPKRGMSKAKTITAPTAAALALNELLYKGLDNVVSTNLDDVPDAILNPED